MKHEHGEGVALVKVRELLAAHGYEREPLDIPKHHTVERYRKAGGVGITVVSSRGWVEQRTYEGIVALLAEYP
jgi:hypothetical protein